MSSVTSEVCDGGRLYADRKRGGIGGADRGGAGISNEAPSGQPGEAGLVRVRTLHGLEAHPLFAAALDLFQLAHKAALCPPAVRLPAGRAGGDKGLPLS